jgi:SPP1 family predicted phage head-tail adaptor
MTSPMSNARRIGAFRNRFTIEQSVRVADGSGGYSESWIAVGEIWGLIRAIGGTERFQHDRMAGTVSHEIVVRHRDGLTPGLRLRIGLHRYHLRAVFAADNRRRYLICQCEERDL